MGNTSAGCSDQTVWICDASSGANVKALKGHSGRVTSVAFSPDGRQVVSGSMDHTVKLWDAANGANLLTLDKHTEWVTAVAFSSDGTRIASGSEDSTIRLWDVSNGARVRALTEHASRVAFSTDGATLALLSTDNKIRILDAFGGPHLRILHGHWGGITYMGFSPDGRQFVVGSKSIRVWSGGSIQAAHKLKGHAGMVLAVAFSPIGPQMASGSDDKSVILWDIEAGTRLRTFICHSEAVTYLAFSRDGKRIVSGANDNIIGLWEARSGALVEKIRNNTASQISANSTEAGVFVMDGGWLCFAKGRQRIFWIPVALRPSNAIQVLRPNTRIAFQTRIGKMIIVELGLIPGLTEGISRNNEAEQTKGGKRKE